MTDRSPVSRRGRAQRVGDDLQRVERLAFERFEEGPAAGGDVADLLGAAELLDGLGRSRRRRRRSRPTTRPWPRRPPWSPWRTASTSNLPIGPFQTTVPASWMISRVQRRSSSGRCPCRTSRRGCRGRRRPWSRRRPRACRRPGGRRGRTSLAPASLEQVPGDVELVGLDPALADRVPLGLQEGVGHRPADQQLVDLRSRFSMTRILSETLAPPITAT